MESVTIQWNGTVLRVARGTRLSEAISHHAPCGGHGRCGKCRVIARGALSPVCEAERQHLSAAELSRGVRLACLCTVEGDCTVTSEAAAPLQILTKGSGGAIALAPTFRSLGVAIDLGTTTLAAKLLDRTGACLATKAAPNPQAQWGADVISRIEAALRGEKTALSTAVREAIDALLAALATAAGRRAGEIDRVVITGNSAMLHLLTEADVTPLSRAPFAIERRFGETLCAKDLSLTALCPDTPVYLPPCIASFVGADTTCALLATGLLESDAPALLCDIGTNGEMALVTGGTLTVCSTAAGPALEGVGISMGMQATDGAIDAVSLVNGLPFSHVIGEGPARGICGSGLVDAVACLLDAEEMDETGLLSHPFAALTDTVCLTQQDIRAVQTAKAAIAAGIEALLSTAGLSATDVTAFHLAGGFGSYLNLRSATRIGLFPHALKKCALIAGNAALSGAVMLLLDADAEALCRRIVTDAIHLELATNKAFTNAFVEGMLFP